MEARPPQLPVLLQALRQELIRRFYDQFRRYWFRVALAGIAITALVRKDLRVNISWDTLTTEEAPIPQVQPLNASLRLGEEPPLNVSLLNPRSKKKTKRAEPAKSLPAAVGLTETEVAKRKQQENYVKHYATIAQAEMKKFGIPASITLAQGLLETNAGASPLVSTANNHFGIKCFSKSCRKGHCRNYSDDSHKDFFRIYPNAWESYRAHSLLLQAPRYKALYKLSDDDYKAWAHGLKSAGYATDPNYAGKLIRLVESLGLHKFDK